jgi:adenosylcobinamide-GDP ribazoletransferase
MSGLVTAICFHTRLPVRPRARHSGDLARSVPWFPVVGLGIGAAIAIAYVVMTSLLPNTVSAVLAVSLGLIVTGALHEDGLGDVADAFAGGWTTEQRLRILDDPRLGTFGVLALVATFLLRTTTIAALDTVSALALIPAAHALSRVPGIVLMRHQPIVRGEGLAVGFATNLSWTQEVAGVAVGVSIATVLLGMWVVAAISVCIVVSWGMATWARRKVGGITGDALGAIQQLCELTVLLLGVAVIRSNWFQLVWWES